MLGTVGAAKDYTVMFDTVANHATATMVADRRERVNGALKGVKGLGMACHGHRERFVIVISANIAFHGPISR